MDSIVTSQLETNNYGNVCSSYGNTLIMPGFAQDNSSTASVSPISDLTDCYYPINQTQNQDFFQRNNLITSEYKETIISPSGYINQGMDFQQKNQWSDGDDLSDNLWNVEDIWFLKQQFNM